MTERTLGSGETQLETIISYVLIIGVIFSMIIISTGIALYYRTYGNVQISQSPAVFINGQNFFAFIINEIPHFMGSMNALTFITIGLIILILTPYVRAITSAIYFAWEKHYKYVLITLFVLIVLTISLILH